MPSRKDLLLKRLTEEGAKTAVFMRALADGRLGRLGQQVYTTGPEWQAGDLLAHLVSAEQTFLVYTRDALAGGPGVPGSFDIDAYNAAAVEARRGADPETLAAEFEAARAETVALVRSLDEADLDRIHFHPWLGRAPLEQILKLLYRHTMLHERDVRKALETGQPVPRVDAAPRAASPQGVPMSARKDALRQQIAADHAASLTLLKSLPAEAWGRAVPSDEGAAWTARDVLAHLAISEVGQLGQITRCLAGEATVPDDFDLNRFNRGSVKKRADRSVADLLAEIEAGHAQVLAQLDKTAEADLDRTGRHARGDTITVEQFFRRITEHRLAHCRELQRALAA